MWKQPPRPPQTESFGTQQWSEFLDQLHGRYSDEDYVPPALPFPVYSPLHPPVSAMCSKSGAEVQFQYREIENHFTPFDIGDLGSSVIVKMARMMLKQAADPLSKFFPQKGGS